MIILSKVQYLNHLYKKTFSQIKTLLFKSWSKYQTLPLRCQSYHVCASDGRDGLLEYSFLCPNGTIFNQQYFICDWWFNVDCSQVRKKEKDQRLFIQCFVLCYSLIEPL